MQTDQSRDCLSASGRKKELHLVNDTVVVFFLITVTWESVISVVRDPEEQCSRGIDLY
jgi:hypothetical protein